MAKYCVVTPCYNSARFLSDTIESVRRQDTPDWEYILVDDGSTDETPAIVERFAATDPRIKLVRQKNAGTSAARNTGARSAATFGFWITTTCWPRTPSARWANTSTKIRR